MVIHGLAKISSGVRIQTLLTGRAEYTNDVKLPGMLYAAVLRSPYAHARIVSIDTSAAKKLPGVHAVLTGRESTEVIDPLPAFCAEPVVEHAIAVEKVRYAGEAVVAVAAESRYIAEDALELVQIEWEPLATRHRSTGSYGSQMRQRYTRISSQMSSTTTYLPLVT